MEKVTLFAVLYDGNIVELKASIGDAIRFIYEEEFEQEFASNIVEDSRPAANEVSPISLTETVELSRSPPRMVTSPSIVAEADIGSAESAIEPASAMASSPLSRFLNIINHPFTNHNKPFLYHFTPKGNVYQ